jgi:uncharacterized alpha-E superfamily protein
VISRVAGSCFWLNRYMERTEDLARMIGVNHSFQLDVNLPETERWRPLVVVTGQEKHFVDITPEARRDDAETVLQYLTWDEDNPSSLVSSLRGARENARTIRETISLEMWEVLNDLWVWMRSRPAKRTYQRDRHEFYLHVRNQCMLFHGVAQSTMLHEDPFEFMRLGTALERASQTARLLDVKHHSIGPTEADVETPAEAAHWLATLRSCSGVEPFLKGGDQPFSGRAVADFLLFEGSFARSVLHNLRRARNFLDLVRPPAPSPVGERSKRMISDAIDRFESWDIDKVFEQGLHEVVTWVVDTTAEICVAIHDDFFDPPPVVQAVTPTQSQTQSPAGAQSQTQTTA